MKGLITLNSNEVYKKYYCQILNYCYAKLSNRQLAEDCTQEVFLALSRKMHSLKLNSNVAAWLYTAAKFEINRCYRKNKGDISLDDTEEILQEESEPQGIFDDILTEDEYILMNDYYVNGEDVKKLSSDRKLSSSAMYQKINRIKQKIIQNADKLHNLLHK